MKQHAAAPSIPFKTEESDEEEEEEEKAAWSDLVGSRRGSE